MQNDARKQPILAAALIAIGGVLVIVSYALHWGRVAAANGSGHRDIKGGSVVLVAGIIGILLGVGARVLQTRGARIAVGVVAILGGLLTILVGAAGTSTSFIRDTVADQLADENGVSHKEAEAELKHSEQAGTIKTSTQAGVFFALGGGILVLIGGIGTLIGARRQAAAEGAAGFEAGGPPPPPPSQLEQTAPPPMAPPVEPPPPGPPPPVPPPPEPPPQG